MRVILIHGFNASPDMNFHPWLRQQLVDRGFKVVAPTLELRASEEFDLPGIIDSMKKQIGVLGNDDIILGHSLGGLLALQYLQAVEMVETPRAMILVASPWKVAKPELQRLFMLDLDADVVMWKAREYVIIHSKDDKLVPIEHARLLANALKARLVETDGDDHYMGEEYPVLLETIEELAARPFEYAPGQALKNDFENVALSDRIAPKETEKPDWMT